MTDIRFNEEKDMYTQRGLPARRSFARVLMDLSGGLIKTEQAANHILFGAVLVVLLTSFFFLSSAFSSGLGPPGKTPIPPGPVRPNGFPASP